MKLISIVTPCYNEELNVLAVYEQTKAAMANLPHYCYEHIFIDNASTDKTVSILKEIAAQDKNVKIIVNSRNFGHIRSPYYGLLQAKGDAVISLVSDLQDPPAMVVEFIKKWEQGYKIVVGTKPTTQETFPMSFLRKMYYTWIARISTTNLIKNFTGFGLYDQKIIEILRGIKDPYPYFRGLISELGFDVAEIHFEQPRRARGLSKNNFYTLYDIGMLGITNHSKVPIRLATMAGFVLSVLSFIVSVTFFLLKLIYWDKFAVGVAPILIGVFFFSSIQLFFIGMLGEYIASIHTQILNRPLVIESERVNF